MAGEKAYTRAVSPALADCALTHMDSAGIDAARAAEQHARYEEALRQTGLAVERLAELLDSPDGVFVEDTAIILGEHAVITRPGAASRAGETASTAAGLAADFDIHHLGAGTIDGGDVLRIGHRLYVGLTSRTNAAAIGALAELAGQFGYSVEPVEVRGCLHLKTGATYAGHDAAGSPTLLINPDWVSPDPFKDVKPLSISSGEPFAANSLRIGGRLIIAAGSLATRERLAARGFDLIELDISELQKAEAGLTCMSLLASRS